MKLFKHREDDEATRPLTTEELQEECTHGGVLLARWDDIDDMGHEDRATSFLCEACGAVFTPAEAARVHANRTLAGVH